MHILFAILAVIGGLFGLAAILVLVAYAVLTSNGSNPFQ